MEVSSEIKQEEMSEVTKQEIFNEQITSNNVLDKNIKINYVQKGKKKQESLVTKPEDNSEKYDEINEGDKSTNESEEMKTEEIKNEVVKTDNEADIILGI